MASKKFFYDTSKFVNVEFAKREAELLVGQDLNKLFNNKDAIKLFTEEIYPIIKLAEYLNMNEIYFCGNTNRSIDAQIKNLSGDIVNVECTTSINGHYKNLLREYNKEYGYCTVVPHSKSYNIDCIESACSSDIVYSGTQHKRKFVNQEDLDTTKTFESGIIDVRKYVIEDIEKIQNKIDKGNNANLYRDFVLVLVCEHSIDQLQVNKYQVLISEYWESVETNPFSALFIVNYDCLLFKQMYSISKLNPLYVPIPILYLGTKKKLYELWILHLVKKSSNILELFF